MLLTVRLTVPFFSSAWCLVRPPRTTTTTTTTMTAAAAEQQLQQQQRSIKSRIKARPKQPRSVSFSVRPSTDCYHLVVVKPGVPLTEPQTLNATPTHADAVKRTFRSTPLSNFPPLRPPIHHTPPPRTPCSNTRPHLACVAMVPSPPLFVDYDQGFYYFVLHCPDDYPHNPPRVRLLTTGGGKVRFNPNLYANGKVCLR